MAKLFVVWYIYCIYILVSIVKNYHSGTSNIVLPVANKAAFPAEYKNKSRLAYYASLFNSLEVNSSFYKVPMGKTVARWATEVPAGFTFTFKLYKGITHNKGLLFNDKDVAHFIQVINQVGEKKGCLLIQFPAGTHCNTTQLKKLLGCVQKYNHNNGWKVGVELRHTSWYVSKVYSLLQSFDAAMVVHDMPKSATPGIKQQAGFMFLRFHGPLGDYRGGYSNEVLYNYATRVRGWLQDGKAVYVYFNNTIGDALPNLVTLNGYVKDLTCG